MKKKIKREDDFMPTAIIMTPQKKSRISLDKIREKSLEKRKSYDKIVYDAEIENDFFKDVECQIYNQIEGEEE